mmetsp:Transcript_5679/g.16771  ORF Transcript_5679/g.16771 Transcript_5679/m.16771 type:complete len:95 (-) Transcript_5679:15-299(-)
MPRRCASRIQGYVQTLSGGHLFLEKVSRALTPLEQFRSQAFGSNDAGDGPSMEWLKQQGRSEFALAKCKPAVGSVSGAIFTSVGENASFLWLYL